MTDLKTQRREGSEVAQLLKNRHFQEMLETLRQQQLDVFEHSAGKGAIDEWVKAHAALAVLADIRRHFESIVERGNVAAKKLDQG